MFIFGEPESKINMIIADLNKKSGEHSWTSADTAYFLTRAEDMCLHFPAQTYMIKGIVYALNNDIEQMERNFKLALQILPHDEVILENYLISYYITGLFIDGIIVCTNLLETMNPKPLWLYNYIGKFYLLIGLKKKAFYYLSKIYKNIECTSIDCSYVQKNILDITHRSFIQDKAVWQSLANR